LRLGCLSLSLGLSGLSRMLSWVSIHARCRGRMVLLRRCCLHRYAARLTLRLPWLLGIARRWSYGLSGGVTHGGRWRLRMSRLNTLRWCLTIDHGCRRLTGIRTWPDLLRWRYPVRLRLWRVLRLRGLLRVCVHGRTGNQSWAVREILRNVR
jgi:hypothetical protein